MTDHPLTRWHVGPWTHPASRPGEPLQPGLRRTPDEANFDVVGLARILGRRLSPREELQVRLWQNELRPTHTRLCGVHTLADTDNARRLAGTADAAFAWLAARAPTGYRFTRSDTVRLEPVPIAGPAAAPDPRTDAVSGPGPVGVDAVVRAATERGLELPAARLACAHVRRRPDGWVAADVACVWSGPHPAEAEARTAVDTARADLADQLRAAGAVDLAATAAHWPATP